MVDHGAFYRHELAYARMVTGLYIAGAMLSAFGFCATIVLVSLVHDNDAWMWGALSFGLTYVCYLAQAWNMRKVGIVLAVLSILAAVCGLLALGVINGL